MPNASCTIQDLGGTGSIVFTLNESSPQESASPTPSGLGKTYNRAIVQHPIPGLDRDIGQDMGAYSREYTIEGLSLQDVRDKLEAFFLLPQITVANPGGRFSVSMTTGGGVSIINQSGLTIKSWSWRYVGGLKRWFRYAITFVEFEGQT